MTDGTTATHQPAQSLRPESRSSTRQSSGKTRSAEPSRHKSQRSSNYPLSESSQACSTVYGAASHDPWVRKEHRSSSRPATQQSSRPVSQQSVQSSRPASRQSHKSLKAEGNLKPNGKVSSNKSSNEDLRAGSPTSQRSITPLASHRSVSPRTVSPTLTASGSFHSRRSTPRNSPTPRESK